MPSLRVLVDAGALIALLNRNDAYHERVSDFFADYFGHAYSTWPVLTEAAHLVPEHLSVSVLGTGCRGRLAGSGYWSEVVGVTLAQPLGIPETSFMMSMMALANL